MSEQIKLIRIKLEHVSRMHDYLQWKPIRELRNAVHHEYEDDGARLAEFFALMVGETPALFEWCARLNAHCISTYGVA